MGRKNFPIAMLSISIPRSGSGTTVNYHLQGKEEYYLQGIEQKGMWIGLGAEMLGLNGKVVEREVFRNLLDGFSPDRKHKLVQNAGSIGRQSCWDLVFNTPKSVSVLWALGDDPIRHRIVLAHRHAMQVAMGHAQEVAGLTRRGKGGKDLEPGFFVIAAFEEGTSRANDMHLHTHMVLINCAGRLDSTFGTLVTRELFREKMMIGSIYQTVLAMDLRQSLGLAIEPRHAGFHISGVPEELCEAFSKRGNDIKRVMKERGLQGAEAAKRIAEETRPGKENLAQSKLFPRWQQEAEVLGWGREQAVELVRSAQVQEERKQHCPEPQISVKEFQQRLEQAVSSVPGNRRTRSRAVRQGLKLAMEFGFDAGTLVQVVNEVDTTSQKWLLVEWKRMFDKTPWVPARRQFAHVSWVSPFPKAWWGPARNFKIPAMTINLPAFALGPRKQFKGRWGEIQKKWDLPIGELRVQRRNLFPKHGQRSVLHRLSVPAVRFTFRKTKWQPLPLKRTQEQDIQHSH